MAVLSRDNPVALWRQLKDRIRDLVDSGLAPGDQIPAENDLCERYGISRTVVRQAIDSLVNEGLLFRRQGQGTFVAPGKLEQNLVGTYSPDGPYRTSMPDLSARFIGAEERPPNPAIKRYLRVSDRDLMLRVRRVRLSGDEPIAYQLDVVPKRLCPALLSDQAGLLEVGRTLSRKHGLVPSHVSVEVECVTADAERARWLGIEEGAPLMAVHRVFYLSSGEPYRYCRTRYRHDRFTLVFPPPSRQQSRAVPVPRPVGLAIWATPVAHR